jgi:tRNA 2-selenouridine synthase
LIPNKQIPVEEFIARSKELKIIDVRTPDEFVQGHIPGAYNVPLFSNEERKIVGTLYKNEGKKTAFLKGLEIVGPKMVSYIKEITKVIDGEEVLLYCWRGGMRSSSMAWLLNSYGLKTNTLLGGYKQFRNFVLNKLDEDYKLLVLGGKTGSNKTIILESLFKNNCQILDLEGMAKHKGSAFGGLEDKKQPSNEFFENKIVYELISLDYTRPIVVEDESRLIGKVKIPDAFYIKMRNTKVLFLDVPKEIRIRNLVEGYSEVGDEKLISAINAIRKKLGDKNATDCISMINKQEYAPVVDLTLNYYDRAYLKGLSVRDQSKIHFLKINSENVEKNVKIILKFVNETRLDELES